MPWSGYGSGTPADPYIIETLNQLQEMKDYLDASFLLWNDIDASATATWNERPTAPGEYYGFQPIGTDGNMFNLTPFTGTFDGDGYTISNLYINRQQWAGAPPERPVGWNQCGLFGEISRTATGGFVKDLTLTNVNITGYSLVGALVGFPDTDDGHTKLSIENCNSSGVVNVMGGGDCGGLIGASLGITVKNCFSSCTVNSTVGDYLGGLIGHEYETVFIDCFATGAVTGASIAGGFVGNSGGFGSSFTDCYATGNLSSGGHRGGFVGEMAGPAEYTSCYATGNVVYTGTGVIKAGGFAGQWQYDCVMSKCWASGDVTANSSTTVVIGGFVGEINDYGTGSISQCYATGEVNATAASANNSLSAGGFVGYATSNGATAITIENSFARGDVCPDGITWTGARIGGFAGNIYQLVEIDKCYSTGAVNDDSTNGGGFIGKAPNTPLDCVISDCFWDTTTSGWATSYGGTGKTTALMKAQSIFENADWDFDTIWQMDTIGPQITQNTVWLSKSGDYDNYKEGLNDDDSITITVPTQNELRWLAALESLLLGTAGDEWRIGSNKLETAITPENSSGAKQQSEYGSASVQPVKINSSLLFVDFVSRKLREMTYVDPKYESPDLTALAEHITLNGITSIARQKNPDSILWMTLGDGSLISMTYERDQNVVAWAKHPLGGNGYAQSVCVIPGASEDVIYLSVARTLTGDTVYWEGEEVYWEDVLVTDYIGEVVYIEKMAPRVFTTIEDAFFVDCGITFESETPTSTITGLDHLDGETVKVLGDGVVLDDAVVEDGQITAKLAGVETMVS
ncbi:MAG: hypothetical protein PHF37_03300, partial [Phycisphaerae bacterium]|nr:hypothetical protein [Phycisphaerae bacterium]